ncbi:hypothetical protein J6Y50_01750 [bacterium]|nr:hypothetical protein [bacterium]
MSAFKDNLLDFLKNNNLLSYKYYKKQLNKKDQNIYDNMYQGLISFSKEIVLPNSSSKNFFDIYDNLEDDNPLIFFVKTISGTDSKIYPEYRFNAKQTIEIISEILVKFKPFTDTLKNMSDVQKEQKIHDYFCSNIIYDDKCYEFHKQGIYNRIKSSSQCVGPLLYGKGLCIGIAKAVKLLLDIVRVKSIVVKSDSHAWNIVYIDGIPYHLDVTFDICNSTSNMIRYDYFNLSDEDISVDHELLNSKAPHCNVSNDYYINNGMFMRRQEDFRKYLRKSLESGKYDIAFKLPIVANIENAKRHIFNIVDEIARDFYSSWQSHLCWNDKLCIFHLHITGNFRR